MIAIPAENLSFFALLNEQHFAYFLLNLAAHVRLSSQIK